MIQFEEFQLENGLQVIVHEDPNSTLVCMNVLYRVGSRNESPDRTGFAHLFEHLMFGGSKHISNFDTPLQAVGGDNNAFTSPDITNYYVTIPSHNVETAFWLESDRMLSLSFDPEVLEVQRKVVIEEFKQRYLNQPYGDLWLKLRPMAYKVHPYRWATIGKEIRHIEEATMDDVKNFFGRFYGPNNATLVLAGGITLAQAKTLTQKWFGPIPSIAMAPQVIPTEPPQNENRFQKLEAEVPSNALYKVYHMPARMDSGYYASDLLSDLLGRGKSSMLYQELVQDQQIFNSISAYIMDSADPGLLTISGKLRDGASFEAAEAGIDKIIQKLKSGKVDDTKIESVKNQAESSIAFGEVEVLNRAMGLAYSAFLGNPDLINQDLEKVRAVTKSNILDQAQDILQDNNSSTIHYHKTSA